MRWLLYAIPMSLIACADIHRSTLDEGFGLDDGTVDFGDAFGGQAAMPGDAAEAPVDSPEPSTQSWSPQGEVPVLAEGTFLQGSFGNNGYFAMVPNQVQFESGPYATYIQLHAIGDHGWTMLALGMDGELGVWPLVPGNAVTFRRGWGPDGEPDTGDLEPVSGDAQGCSGPSVWDWRADDITDDVTVVLSLDPGTGDLVLGVDAEFAGYGGISATVVVR